MKLILVAMLVMGLSTESTANDLTPSLEKQIIRQFSQPCIAVYPPPPLCYIDEWTLRQLCRALHKLAKISGTNDPREMFLYAMKMWGNGGDCMTLEQFTDMWVELGLIRFYAEAAFNAINTNVCVECRTLGSDCIDEFEWVRAVKMLHRFCRSIQPKLANQRLR